MWCEHWEEYESEALALGVSHEEYWTLTPRQVGDLIIKRRNNNLELAYYQSLITGAAVWGKAPKEPLKVGNKEKEQDLNDMAFNMQMLKAYHNKNEN